MKDTAKKVNICKGWIPEMKAKKMDQAEERIYEVQDRTSEVTQRRTKYEESEESLHKTTGRFLNRNFGCQEIVQWYIQTADQEHLALQSFPLENKDKIKNFPDKQKLRKFITARPALQEMFKEALLPEMKRPKYAKPWVRHK